MCSSIVFISDLLLKHHRGIVNGRYPSANQTGRAVSQLRPTICLPESYVRWHVLPLSISLLTHSDLGDAVNVQNYARNGNNTRTSVCQLAQAVRSTGNVADVDLGYLTVRYRGVRQIKPFPSMGSLWESVSLVPIFTIVSSLNVNPTGSNDAAYPHPKYRQHTCFTPDEGGFQDNIEKILHTASSMSHPNAPVILVGPGACDTSQMGDLVNNCLPRIQLPCRQYRIEP